MGGRRQKFKEPKPGLYIVGEGITEKYYFDHLKTIFGFKCIVRPRFFTKTCIAKLENEIKALLRGDIFIICVFDADVSKRDVKENQKLENLKNKYKKNKNVLICDSLPSIEYWFLIHFKDTCPNFTKSSEAEKALIKYILNYDKTADFLKNEKWVREMSCLNGSIRNAKNRAIKYRTSTTSYSKIDLAIDKLEETRD
jgi:hypothetical protein